MEARPSTSGVTAGRSFSPIAALARNHASDRFSKAFCGPPVTCSSLRSSSVIRRTKVCASMPAFCRSSVFAVPNAAFIATRICGSTSASWLISSALILPLLAICVSARVT